MWKSDFATPSAPLFVSPGGGGGETENIWISANLP